MRSRRRARWVNPSQAKALRAVDDCVRRLGECSTIHRLTGSNRAHALLPQDYDFLDSVRRALAPLPNLYDKGTSRFSRSFRRPVARHGALIASTSRSALLENPAKSPYGVAWAYGTGARDELRARRGRHGRRCAADRVERISTPSTNGRPHACARRRRVELAIARRVAAGSR